MAAKLYHEKQRRQLCLVHALNALVQEPRFQQSDVDAICEQLDPSRWLNAHRSWLGLGNYDANVLLVMLEKLGYEARWHDGRQRAVESLRSEHDDGKPDALIFNVASRSFGLLPGRHWFTVLRKDDRYYNLDSKEPAPKELPGEIEAYAQQVLDDQRLGRAEMFVVRRKIQTEGQA